MSAIKLLDCTLRDGGYINNWRFGRENIDRTIELLENAGVDILELGFLKDEPLDPDRTVFGSIEGLTELMPEKKPGIIYAAMAEAFCPIPMELVSPRSSRTVDVIRVIVWKDKHDGSGNLVDALLEGYEYCKGFVEKGYDLYVQPARAEQYSDDEFADMLYLYSRLRPKAIYIVDSWGTMYSDDVIHYLKLADKILDKDISIGFHGHNNMMQAFANALDFISYGTERELILDSTVYGMGRGAGNLNTEIIAKYLNERKGKKYDLRSFFCVYEKTIKELSKKHTWGYSVPYFMTALHHVNPQYGSYYEGLNCMTSMEMDDVMGMISEEDKVMYETVKARGFLEKIKREKRK